MPRHTNGFEDPLDALIHFEEHGGLLGVDTLGEYVDRADAFLGTALAELAGVEECQRPTLEWVRYNVATLEFGVLTEDRRFILTYYIAEPHRLGGRTFRQYCEDQCLRRWGRA